MSDPDRDPHATSRETPSDELVLAAVERAALHHARDTPAVPVWSVMEHLDLRRRTAAARHVVSRLDALHAGGWLASSRRHGAPTWVLTASGGERLRRARLAGSVPELPESPQHRAWRAAHTAAAQEIERFRRELRERLDDCARLLDAHSPPHSDVWFELAEELQRASRRVGSASHCLHEWAEPDDEHADVDVRVEPDDEELEPGARLRRQARRAGRRNVRLWNGGGAREP
jgi:hypothetical protein